MTSMTRASLGLVGVLLAAGSSLAPGLAEAPAKAQHQSDAREIRKVIAANRATITSPFHGAFAGNPRATITLVEYYDYNCGYCRATKPVIDQFLARHHDTRIVFRELPILGPESREAARLSLVAAAQGKFTAFHDHLFAGGRVTSESLVTAAAKTGVDVGQLAALAPGIDAEIARNLALSRKLGFSGTPSWVVGDHAWSGAVTIEILDRTVAAARREHGQHLSAA